MKGNKEFSKGRWGPASAGGRGTNAHVLMQRASKMGIAQEVVIHATTLDLRPFSCRRNERRCRLAAEGVERHS